jgi:uncharacterized protein (TIGR03000 family)
MITVPEKKGTDKKGPGGGGGDEDAGAMSAPVPAPATMVVTLPANATLTVDGHATTSTSSYRRFVTPMLEPGTQYYYTLQAKLVADGKETVVTKRVLVSAGQETRTELDLPMSTASAR